jgi:ATP-dependent Clp protease ATP-binding subunit ClpB
LGSQWLSADVSRHTKAWEKAEEQVMQTVRGTFRPEFLNRLDDILIFSPLQRESMDSIVRIQLMALRKAMQDRHMHFTITDQAISWLGEKGYDPAYGARPLKRVIQKDVVDPLSTLVLQGKLFQGSSVHVHVAKDQLVIDHHGVDQKTP